MYTIQYWGEGVGLYLADEAMNVVFDGYIEDPVNIELDGFVKIANHMLSNGLKLDLAKQEYHNNILLKVKECINKAKEAEVLFSQII